MLQGKTTILIVDDTLVNIKLLSNVLARQNYIIRTAINGETALRMTEANPPDLILLDIAMPEMDGYSVCRQLKANPKTQDIPIIFISALIDTDDIVKGFELGGVDYITKPFRLREVIARVESHLTLLRQRQEIAMIHERDRQQFSRINALRNQLIGTATHDLKNPLSVITGHAYLLQRHAALTGDDSAQGYLNMINRAAGRMHRIIKNMFDLIQIESSPNIDLKTAPLKAFLQACQEEHSVRARAKDITLTLAETPDIEITMESDRMTQAVEQLISNAIKYTPAGGRVTLRGYEANRFAVIEVVDTGVGIHADDLPHIFTAFYRVNNAPAAPDDGSGLGLSIVKAILDQHRGQVQVESESNGGTCFRLLVPMPIPEDPSQSAFLDDDLEL